MGRISSLELTIEFRGRVTVAVISVAGTAIGGMFLLLQVEICADATHFQWFECRWYSRSVNTG
jgi:hypothetical protein